MQSGVHEASLAFDIGGTKLAVAVVDRAGSVGGLQVVPTGSSDGPEPVIARLLEAGERALAGAGTASAPSVAGIACGGPLDIASGRVLSPLHLPGWDDVPIVEIVTAHFGLSAVLENDATAATLAEHTFGWGVGVPTMLYLTISTGIGGGAIIDGRLHRGAAGNGCEFGQIMVHPGGQEFGSGRAGRLEAYASGAAIAFRARNLLTRYPGSVLTGLERVLAEDVVDAAVRGDALARSVWGDALEALGIALTDLVNIFEPNLVVLGGGVTRAGHRVLDPVRRAVAEGAMAPAASVVRIEISKLGDLVGVVGAGLVGLQGAPERMCTDA